MFCMGIKFAHLNLQVSCACCTLVLLKNIASRSNYHIGSLWTNAQTYNLSCHSFFLGGRRAAEGMEWVFMGKEGASMGGCFTLVESLWLLLLIFCLLPANCVYSLFVWMHFSNCFISNCICALSWDCCFPFSAFLSRKTNLLDFSIKIGT